MPRVREVICNTSPLQYLHQTGFLEVLPRLYGRVTVMEAVAAELEAGRQAGIDLPDPSTLAWADVRTVRDRSLLPVASDLGPGEREVLARAVEIEGSLAILDDRLARQYAGVLGVTITGTLGVLVKAKRAGHLQSVAPIVDRLEELRFRLDPGTRAAISRLAGEKL